MTNTLHRYGDPDTLKNDYIVFAIATRKRNDENSVEKFKTFLRLAAQHNPVNMGDATKGGMYQPSKSLTPIVHWHREDPVRIQEVIEGIDKPTTAAAVFDNLQAVKEFLEDLKKADLGLSINISALTDDANRCCKEVGITRHSVEYSLGFRGALDKLPDKQVLEITTMCGHGMISAHFAKKMIDWVREGRRTPEEATRYMARFCSCGVFNPVRAKQLLEQVCRPKVGGK
ncbi:MAG TPA: hypothetical protein VNM22_14200 [Candidatus Limnocylindrales bacterium]|nr:hypothetical protein [Candidatus Limnocylindrales bacterium]